MSLKWNNICLSSLCTVVMSKTTLPSIYAPVCQKCKAKRLCKYKHDFQSAPFECQCGEPASYLDLSVQGGGGLTKNLLEWELNRASFCKTTYAEFETESGDETFYKQITCNKWWCPDCGGKGGNIHRDRLGRVLRRVGDLDRFTVGYFVYTVPSEYWGAFMSREMLNKLYLVVKRNVMNYFPDYEHLIVAHLFGDKDLQFKPHINVILFMPKNDQWKIASEKLDRLKFSYNKALTGLLGLSSMLSVVDVRYSYRAKIGQKIHTLKYVLRPLNEKFLKCSEDVLRFLIIEMKGFNYMRYSKRLRGKENDKFICELFGSSEALLDEGLLSPVSGMSLRWVRFLTSEKFELLMGGRSGIKQHPGGLLELLI